jgi:hypothetical protein
MPAPRAVGCKPCANMSCIDVVLGSSLAFALALTLISLAHETAHALAGAALGTRPVLHGTYVERGPLPPRAAIAVALTGPLAGLALGAAAYGLYHGLPDAPLEGRLLLLWLALHGLVNFFGSFVLVPFASNSDFGKIAAILRFGRAGRVAALAVGLAATAWIGHLATGPILELAPAETDVATGAARSDYVARMALAAWGIGAVLAVLVRLPAPYRASLVYPLASGTFTIVSWSEARSADAPAAVAGGWGGSAGWMFALALLALAAAHRTLLARGIPLGRATGRGS